jgi:hypothetical protein
MSLRHNPTIDELLGDVLVQAVMRADNVEPQTLRTLLADAAVRVAADRLNQRPANGLLTKPSLDRRATPRGANAPARVRPASFADPSGSALCC